MSSHARHARPARTVRSRAAALRLGVVLSAAGTAAVATGGSAQAALVDLTDPLSTIGYAVAPAVDLDLYPLGGTGTDPLNNSVGTQVADFQPVSTEAITGPISRGGSVSALTAHVSDLLGGG